MDIGLCSARSRFLALICLLWAQPAQAQQCVQPSSIGSCPALTDPSYSENCSNGVCTGVLECPLADVCVWGVESLSTDEAVCYLPTTACGDQICSGRENYWSCSIDCNISLGCIPGERSCFGRDYRECTALGRWAVVSCRSNEVCQSSNLGPACTTLNSDGSIQAVLNYIDRDKDGWGDQNAPGVGNGVGVPNNYDCDDSDPCDRSKLRGHHPACPPSRRLLNVDTPLWPQPPLPQDRPAFRCSRAVQPSRS